MKKRIGNDIDFTWHIYRKDGEERIPEDFTGKTCQVELLDAYHRKAVIDNVAFGEGVVTWTFKGKNQKSLGTYMAVLYENKGEDGMVAVDVISAVTLVPHSYMERPDRCEDITTSAVEIDSEITQNEQVQADWTETSTASKAYIRNKPNLARVATTGEYSDLDNRPTFDVDEEQLIIF